MHHLHLGGVHDNAVRRDDVAHVLDGGDPKGAFGFLDEELVLLERAEDDAEMAQVISP